MKHLLNRWLLLIILLLALPALACNLPFGGEEEPTPGPVLDDDEDEPSANDSEETEVPEETSNEETEQEPIEEDVEVEETAVPEEPVAEEDDDGLLSEIFQESVNVAESATLLETLDSYEMAFEFSTTVDDASQGMEAVIVTTANPPATQMTFSFAGFAGGSDLTEMKMTQIGETTYTIVPDFGCLTTTEGDFLSESFGQTVSANEFLEDIGEAELVGEETINGVETLHYTFDETAVTDDEFQFNWAQGDVYVAKEGNYVVRFRMEGEGVINNLDFDIDTDSSGDEEPQVGLIQVEMNLSKINEPVTILVPEACEESGAENSDLPVLDDSSDFSSFGGVITYKTETPFAEIITFYQDSLTGDGWEYSEGDSFILEGSTGLLIFDKDGRSLTVTVTEETGTSFFLVVIFEEE